MLAANNSEPIWETDMLNLVDWREAVYKEIPDFRGRESFDLGKGIWVVKIMDGVVSSTETATVCGITIWYHCIVYVFDSHALPP